MYKLSIFNCYLAVFLFVAFFTTGAQAWVDPKDLIYSYPKMVKELEALAQKNSGYMKLEILGQTAEKRHIYAVRLTQFGLQQQKPAVVALFSQHAEEHDTTLLAMYFIHRLLDESALKSLLERVEVVLVPMVNPDGVMFDLSDPHQVSLGWRKNRQPLGNNLYGVDLNRNWGFHWDAPLPPEIEKRSKNAGDSYYHGKSPFSTQETVALRHLLEQNKQINLFLDYHSGDADFSQGMVLLPYTYTDDHALNTQNRLRYQTLAEKFSQLITSQTDGRDGFAVLQSQDIPAYLANKIKQVVPPAYLEKVLSTLPKSALAPGSSIDYTDGQLKILSLGLEISRNKNFYQQYAQDKHKVFASQWRGLEFLLNSYEYDSAGLWLQYKKGQDYHLTNSY